MGAGEARLGAVHRRAAADRPHDRRTGCHIAVGANPDGLALLEIDAVELFEEAVDEMLAALLAVGDDVDAAVLLDLERREHRVAPALGERRAFEAPGRPELQGFGEPGRFRQAAGDRGGKQMIGWHGVPPG